MLSSGNQLTHCRGRSAQSYDVFQMRLRWTGSTTSRMGCHLYDKGECNGQRCWVWIDAPIADNPHKTDRNQRTQRKGSGPA